MSEDLTPEMPEVIGRCRIQKKIGEGGMGSVYLGIHETLDIPRAIKVLPKHIDLKDPEYRQRFFREARLAARLRHPNLVQVHESGAEEGYYYLIMDYVEGPTCRELVESEGRLDWRRAVEVATQVAQGLSFANSKGVIHRDVTPGNIIIGTDGIAYITDMGLAKEISSDTTGLTRSGASLGTPYYMSPEQINSARDVDFRADIYSLGATLYHMVCGTVPYTGTTFEVMTKQVREALPSPKDHVPDLPDALCDVLRKMMAKDPASRYESYGDLNEDLGNLLEGKPVIAAGFTDHSMVTPDIPTAASQADQRAQEETQLFAPAGGARNRILMAAVIVGVLIAVAILLKVLILK